MTIHAEKIGVHLPTVFLPGKSADLTKWAVVACDQYTSQPEYWSEVRELVADFPSTFHMIFPEIYLQKEDAPERIKKINAAMLQYLAEGTLLPQPPGFIYTDRKTRHAASRKGLLLSVDLDKYDYNPGSGALIRATEGTVLERLPPRIKIRENAALELPHILLLIDDPEKTVIEPLAGKCGRMEPLYDTNLMMDGGRIRGYRVDDPLLTEEILAALEKLADPEAFRIKYGVGPEAGALLFAVGDGNHSLASAKACWENLKPSLSEAERMNHPAKYALVEVVNLHDDGLAFEPIHRVVFNTQVPAVLDSMVAYYAGRGSRAEYGFVKDGRALKKVAEEIKGAGGFHILPFVAKDVLGYVSVRNPGFNLEAGTLQAFLDAFAAARREVKIDYIHGDEVLADLAAQDGNIGFCLPAMDKHDLFKTVILEGALPRKTFSMGEADEKRYYLECRKIIK